MHLKNTHGVILAEKEKEKPPITPYCNKEAEENERLEKIRFEEEIKKEAEQKSLLLQAVVNEAASSGFPMPPSLVKLLQSNNGNFHWLYSFYAKHLPVKKPSSGTLMSVKYNCRGHGINIRSVKQDTKEIRTTVLKLENHMSHYNEGMMHLTNYVKVNTWFFFHFIISFVTSLKSFQTKSVNVSSMFPIPDSATMDAFLKDDENFEERKRQFMSILIKSVTDTRKAFASSAIKETFSVDYLLHYRWPTIG